MIVFLFLACRQSANAPPPHHHAACLLSMAILSIPHRVSHLGDFGGYWYRYKHGIWLIILGILLENRMPCLEPTKWGPNALTFICISMPVPKHWIFQTLNWHFKGSADLSLYKSFTYGLIASTVYYVWRFSWVKVTVLGKTDGP